MSDNQKINYVQAIIDKEHMNRALVRFWLYFICVLVFIMVLLGGATRLTDSGLSITEWKPLLGIIPPLSPDAWLDAFEKYQQIPEYNKINKGMSLVEFKFIYWWEWGHRFLGRFIGLVFAVPLAIFWFTGRLESKLKPRLLLLFLLGGLQGFIGWWMVKSGLVDRVDVSQYRLAIHLTLACIIFAYAIWLARAIAPQSISSDEIFPLVITKILAAIIVIFVLFQIFLGGLVAGLDAGLAFNDWPTMDGALIPSGLEVLQPLWLNWFENPKSVQFNHRISAYLLLGLIIFQWWLTQRSGVSTYDKRRAWIILLIGCVQAAFGIITLLLQVPISWALLHQAGALILLAVSVIHWRSLIGPYTAVTSIRHDAY